MKFPITVCIMTLNEEDLIETCIKSAKLYAEEIIVIDTGSTDKTSEIAEKCGAKVYFRKWHHDFSEIRNAMIDLSTQPYIFMLDADEEIVQGQDEQFKHLLKHLEANDRIVGRIVINNYTSDQETVLTSIGRIFKKNPMNRYSGKIHEQLISTYHGATFLNTHIHVIHKGYTPEKINSKGKHERNIELLKSSLDANPNEVYLLYQLGRTYHASKQDKEAHPFLKKAYILEVESGQLNSTLLITYGWNLLRLGEWGDLLILIDRGLTYFPDYTDLYYLYGCSLIEMKTVEALSLVPEVFNNCLKLGEADHDRYETVSGVGSFRASYNLGLYYELLQDYSRAGEYYKKSADCNFLPAVRRLKLLNIL